MFLLSRIQAGPGRTVKQEQLQISRNHVQAFICPPVSSPGECIPHEIYRSVPFSRVLCFGASKAVRMFLPSYLLLRQLLSLLPPARIFCSTSCCEFAWWCLIKFLLCWMALNSSKTHFIPYLSVKSKFAIVLRAILLLFS